MVALIRATITNEETDQTFTFLVAQGTYTSDIATATGVTPASENDNFSDNDLSPIKSLIRAGLLGSLKVKIKDQTSGKVYIKQIRYSTAENGVADKLIGKNWGAGKAAGLPIVDVVYSARVVSRQ